VAKIIREKSGETSEDFGEGGYPGDRKRAGWTDVENFKPEIFCFCLDIQTNYDIILI